MESLRFPGNAHGIVMQQIVQSEAAADLAVGRGLLIELDQGPLGELDQQVLGVQVIQVAGVGPEGGGGGLGDGLVGGEDGQLGEAALLVVRQHLDAGLHRAPDAAVLLVDGLAVGDLLQVRPAQALQHGVEIAAAFPGHAAAEGEGQGQECRIRAPPRAPRRAGPRAPRRRHRPAVAGPRFGEERDGHQLAVERVEDALVAGGDQQPAARAEHVEGLGIGRPPDVVEHQQDRLGGEQVAEHALALRQGGEGVVAAEVAGPGRAGA